MKHSWNLLVCAALSLLIGGNASAQLMPNLQPDDPAPATEMPRMPDPEGKPAPAPTSEAGNRLVAAGEQAGIPPLPPSRPCQREDIVGMWRLLNLYEAPTGPETAAMANSPVQYFLFDQDNTYGRLNAGNVQMPAQNVREAIQRSSSSLHQFVLDQAGMLYFYQDSLAIDTMACFIVANSRTPFQPGQMLLLPPEGQAATRLIKVYEHVKRGPPQNPRKRGRKKRDGAPRGQGRPSAAIYQQ